jgi:YD repeat-containing protein
MDIYDKDGRLIGYVDPAHIQRHPLEETRQRGDRKREEWLGGLAQRSARENWDEQKARQVVEAEVAASPHLRKGAATTISEGCRASDLPFDLISIGCVNFGMMHGTTIVAFCAGLNTDPISS